MPIRSRTHELEELSVARFNELLPSKWVSRAKTPDYGIDREVEIFDEQGHSTGLAFLVQLRATDDPKRSDRVVVETDELDYWAQLDLPVIVARYCNATNEFRWQWESLIRFRVKLADGQKTATYRFDDTELWNGHTPAAIARTLQVRRALAIFPPVAEMPVRFDVSRLPASGRYPAERALGLAVALCAGALTQPREPRTVELEVTCDLEAITLRIDTLTSIRIDLPHASPEELATSALYGAMKLLSYNGLHRQAATIARAILERGIPHHAEELGLAACQTLADDPSAVANLAILHGFHMQTAANAAIMFEIARSPAPEAVRSTAADRFFVAAIEAAAEGGAENVAAVHYSFANSLRATCSGLRALHHYNRARRLRPAYKRAAYFQREVGGVLFLAGRNRCAADAYRAARANDTDPLLALLLGDALMLSGEIRNAENRFEEAAADLPPGAQAQEAELKRLTCAWLRDQTGRGWLEVRRRAADDAMLPDGGEGIEDLERLLRDVDALNPRAHFNLAVTKSSLGGQADATWHFLACAFVQGGDVEAWANAALCAFGTGQAELMNAILTVAINAAGPEVYDRLRLDLNGQGAGAEVIEALDTVASTLTREAQSSGKRRFTLRMLDGEGFEEMTVIGP